MSDRLKQLLVTRGSDLRDPKFTRRGDKPGGGFSKEPFIKQDLPGVEEPNPNLGLLGGNTDFLLRAGTLQRSVEDVSRISQLLLTTGKGNLFTVKQNLLSRTNVKTQAKSIGLNQGPYLPTSTIAQVGVSGLGFHLNKQGLNPFAATGTESGEDGSGGNFFQNIVSNTKLPTYLSADVKGGDSGQTNRLVELRKFKLVGPQNTGLPPTLSKGSRLISNIAGGIDSIFNTGLKNKVNDLVPNVNLGLNNNDISNAKDEILAYGGGPGSELGVGRTRIRRYSDTTSYDTETFRKKNYLLDNGSLEAISDESVTSPHKIRIDFRQSLIGQQAAGQNKNVLSNSIDYTTKNIEQRVGLGSPGRNDKDLTSFVKGAVDPSTGKAYGAVDKVTSLPLYKSKGVTPSTQKNDLIKFRIASIDPHDEKGMSTYIHFRAFLDSFSDEFNSNWESFRYTGRTENFYKFNDFTRTVNLSWTLAAQSRQELIPMYKKLNYLQSNMTGDYSDFGYMEGNLMKLTVGGYLWEQPGFFTSLSTTFHEQSPYEIGIPDGEDTTEFNRNQTIGTSLSVKELPMILSVAASFTPIHDFVPRKQQNVFDYNTRGGGLNSYGRERYVSLSADNSVTSYENAKGDYFVDTPNVNKVSDIQPAKVKPLQTFGPTAEIPNISLPLGR